MNLVTDGREELGALRAGRSDAEVAPEVLAQGHGTAEPHPVRDGLQIFVAARSQELTLLYLRERRA